MMSITRDDVLDRIAFLGRKRTATPTHKEARLLVRRGDVELRASRRQDDVQTIDVDGVVVRIDTANMSIQADIKARVAAFAKDVADLVRRTALHAAEEVLSKPAKLVLPHSATPARPRTAATPPSTRARRPAPEPARVEAPPAPPAPVRRSLKDPRRGKLVAVPSASPPLPVEPPMPVVNVPVVMPRKARAPKPPVLPQPEAVVEPVPARSWVVVRRAPRAPGAEAAAAAAPTSSTTAPDGAGTHAPTATPMQPPATK